jgi:hypothetical protein
MGLKLSTSAADHGFGAGTLSNANSVMDFSIWASMSL